MFGAAVVEDRIGVVDVNEYTAAIRFAGEELEQSVGAGSGRCPISRAFFLLRPVLINSSSLQKVPSRKAMLLVAAALAHS